MEQADAAGVSLRGAQDGESADQHSSLLWTGRVGGGGDRTLFGRSASGDSSDAGQAGGDGAGVFADRSERTSGKDPAGWIGCQSAGVAGFVHW